MTRPIPTIAEALRQLDARAVSVPELLQDCLTRIAAEEPALHAFVALDAEGATKAAAQAQTDRDAGHAPGPLHGIPIGFKDIYETRDLATTAHSAVLRDHRAAADAPTVTRLLEAGAISLGKLSTWEFATGGPSFDLPWAPAANPWNPDHCPGGSSSGTGAAVAAGMILGGTGTDTGGSIRIPAARCGIAGLKPTYGRVPRTGIVPLAFSLDHAGPMAWTTEDCALLLQQMAGHDPRDPASAPARVPDYMATLGAGLQGRRIIVPRHFFETDSPADDDCRAAFEEALSTVARLGAEIREVRLSPLADYVSCATIISRSESYPIHEPDLATRPNDYGFLARQRLASGALYTAADYINALRRRRELVAEFADAMRGADLCLLPTLPSVAPPLRGQSVHTMNERMLYTQPFNVTGSPALSVCNGYSAAGLPFGLQIVGHPFDEAGVLSAGHAYETATAWRTRRPASRALVAA